MDDKPIVGVGVFVGDLIDIQASTDEFSAPGLKSMGPITITGTFLGWNQAICAACGQLFTLPVDGPVPELSVQGREQGPVCDLCAAALLDA